MRFMIMFEVEVNMVNAHQNYDEYETGRRKVARLTL